MAYVLQTPPAFLEPFGEKLSDLTIAELNQPVNIADITPQVAQVSPFVQQAQQRAAREAGLGSLSFDATTGEITGIGSGTGIAAYEPYIQAAAANLGPTGYQQYMSPYQQQVIDSTQQLLNEQRAAGLNTLRGSQVAQGAFGQGRGQVGEAEYLRERDIYDAAALAGLRQQGFSQAQQQANTQAQLQGQLGQSQQALSAGITQQLGTTGAGAQTYSQALLDAITQGNVLGANYPLQRIGSATNIFGGIASGTPQQPIAPITTSPALTAAQTFAGIYSGLRPQRQGQANGGIMSLMR